MFPIRALFDRLVRDGLRFSTAESLTGGLIGGSITALPGSSDVYAGGIISYSADAKVALLGVDRTIIETHGVVSRETAEAMALGALERLDSDVSVAVTGVAGPGGGSPDIPVGTVWLASAKRSGGSISPSVISECRHFSGSRARIRNCTVGSAARLVLAHLDRS